MSDAGWDLNSINSTASVFPDAIRISDHGKHKPVFQHSHATGPAPSWELNYLALSFLMNGQYYSGCSATFGLTGLPVMSDTGWEKLVSWLGKHVEALANISCEQAQQRIIDHGDKLNWTVAFDGFYLTRGYHSNNCSATLHDHSSNKICWFAHRTKKGPGANWQGTSGGAEGDMLRTILEEVKAKGFRVTQIIMDLDTSGGNIACSISPEVRITYCGNNTAKSFYHDLMKIKSLA